MNAWPQCCTGWNRPKSSHKQCDRLLRYAKEIQQAPLTSSIEISVFTQDIYLCIYIYIFKGLRLTAGRRPTWVCVGLGRVHVKLSGAYWALGGAKVGNWSASEMGALY